MVEEIELLRKKLEELILEKESLIDSEVISTSQELDRLIVNDQLC
jgi:hypothetical protein